jgi:hypothetical protein
MISLASISSGPAASAVSAVSAASSLQAPAAVSAAAPAAATGSCETSDLEMSTPSSGEDTTVYSTGTRAVDPVTLSNTSSVDCPDSGFIVLLLPSPVSEPEPTLEWSVGGGWHGTSLSWDDGVVDGNASCASPCWKAGIVTLDVPAHTTETIDLGVVFHSGLNHGFFSGAVYYTSQASLDDGAAGPLVAFAYIDQAGSSGGGSGSGSGGGSGGGSSSGGASGHSPSPAAGSQAASRSAAPATTTSAPAVDSASAAPVATPSLAPVADVHSGGSGMSSVITLIALALLVLAAGTGLLLTRRRRGDQPPSA